MAPMRFRFHKALPIFLLVVGVVLTMFSLIVVLSASTLPYSRLIGVFAGVVMTINGVLMLANPVLKIEPNEVRVCSPVGLTVKRFPVASPADLRFAGKALWHMPSNKKITGMGFFDSRQVAELRSQLPY